jgi:HSP20 family protein
MSMIRRTSPFGELLSLRQAMDRLFEDSYVRPRSWGSAEDGQVLPLDIYGTKDELVIKAALPGIDPNDVEITVTGDQLSIRADSRQEERSEDGGWLYQEIRRGTMARTVSLPGDLKTDAANARFENGMLTLTIPKAEEAKPRQIRIAPTTDGSSDEQAAAGDDAPSSDRTSGD